MGSWIEVCPLRGALAFAEASPFAMLVRAKAKERLYPGGPGSDYTRS